MKLLSRISKGRAAKRDMPPEIREMREREAQLQQGIEDARAFLTQLPELQEQQRRKVQREEQIMPPPGELAQRRRERVLHAKLSRNEVRNNKRYEIRSGSIFIMMVIAAAALIAWAWKIAQSGL